VDLIWNSGTLETEKTGKQRKCVFDRLVFSSLPEFQIPDFS